jgi:cell division initiation protein
VALNNTIQNLHEENHRLNLENQGYRKREDSMKNAMIQSQKVLDQMKENAQKSSELVIATAELEAEKMLNRAHKRLSQLHSDIIELKRQRIQLEMQIGAVIESHSKLIEMTKEENKAADETDSTLKFIKKA